MRLLAQFDEDLYPVQKITLGIVTGNVIGPQDKIRLLRITITPLDLPERWVLKKKKKQALGRQEEIIIRLIAGTGL